MTFSYLSHDFSSLFELPWFVQLWPLFAMARQKKTLGLQSDVFGNLGGILCHQKNNQKAVTPIILKIVYLGLLPDPMPSKLVERHS